MRPACYIGGMYPLIGQPLYPELWRGCIAALAPCLGSTGLTLRDWSAPRRHATAAAVSMWQASGGRYSLNTASNEATLAAAGSGPLVDIGAGDFAIKIWASQASGGGSYSALLGNAAFTGMQFGKNTSTLGCYLGSAVERNSTYTIPADGTWHCYGLDRIGGTCRFWADGKQVGSFTSSASIAGSETLKLGSATGYARWGGNVDDVSVYARGLSTNEWQVLAMRRGIAYEMQTQRKARVFGGFKAVWAARKAQIIGGGL